MNQPSAAHLPPTYSSAQELAAARAVTQHLDSLLAQSTAYQALEPRTRDALRSDLRRIRTALEGGPASTSFGARDPYALAMETPAEAMRRRQQGGMEPAAAQPGAHQGPQPASPQRPQATENLAARAGALSDEIDFAGFVASLIHGAFDAIVESSIRQMEAFAGLVGSVAQDVDRFTSENVTLSQVRDQLAKEHPADLAFGMVEGQPRLTVRPSANDEPRTPSWLSDYGLEGQELSEEVLEEQLVPAARRRVGEQRMQLLATMVLLGMNRIVVRDGSISAKVRFRAAARDRTAVDFALSSDTGGASPYTGRTSAQAAMMVSTVGANAQAETELRAELFGEVKINFASETLPLDRFADSAALLLLQRNASPPRIAGPPPVAGA